MKLGVCLHGGSVARVARPLHPTDRRALALARRVGSEAIAIEATSDAALAPVALTSAQAAGVDRAIRVVEPALAEADAHATGFVLARALGRLKIDALLFGHDADPDGLCDVPACIAHHMAAPYVSGVVDLIAIVGGSGAAARIEATLRQGAWIRDALLPPDAVVGVVADSAAADGPAASGATNAIEIVTLADLALDAALVRRRDDRRGTLEPVSRTPVTLRSAAALTALLKL